VLVTILAASILLLLIALCIASIEAEHHGSARALRKRYRRARMDLRKALGR